jgi:tRNA threonylcarbamoyl adenosine modification protein YjeE
VLALSGDLGAGKTCFIQGLASGLGVEGPVTSPTFIMVAVHAGRLPLYHVDLYRTGEPGRDSVELGPRGRCWDGAGVTAIEWAERAEPLLPSADGVHFHHQRRRATSRAVQVEIDGNPAPTGPRTWNGRPPDGSARGPPGVP